MMDNFAQILLLALRGLGPKFRVSCANQQNPTLLAILATTRVVQVVVSLKAVLGDSITRFLHPKDYVMCLCYT